MFVKYIRYKYNFKYFRISFIYSKKLKRYSEIFKYHVTYFKPKQ